MSIFYSKLKLWGCCYCWLWWWCGADGGGGGVGGGVGGGGGGDGSGGGVGYGGGGDGGWDGKCVCLRKFTHRLRADPFRCNFTNRQNPSKQQSQRLGVAAA